MFKFSLKEKYIFRKLGNTRMQRVCLALAYGMPTRQARIKFQEGSL